MIELKTLFKTAEELRDKFQLRYNELVAENEGYEEDEDEYLAENIFFIPQ